MKILTLSALGVITAFCLPALADENLPDRQTPIPASPKIAGTEYIKPRPLSDVPQGEFGDKVRLGYQLFVNSQQLRGKYVGNELNCTNCHMDAGRKPNAAPLWGAYFAYPAYRKKNDKVNSFEERVQGCVTYSMNGTAPASGSPELVAIAAYSYWLGVSGLMDKYNIAGNVPELSDAELLKGAKRDDFPLADAIKQALDTEQLAKLPGRGYPSIPKPEQAFDPARGKIVYQAHCQVCHGDNGQGQSTAGIASLPPLWGAQSYNWGAGMHQVKTAAFFIHENMPFGKSVQLTNQQAWDVAAFINSQERPQDPRSKGDVAETQKTYHNHEGYYGKPVNGVTLGKNAYPNMP